MKHQTAAADMANNQSRHLLMLNALNTAASALLVADEGTFESSLAECMTLVNQCADVDRVYIWKNEALDGELYYVNRYEWLRYGSYQGLIVHPTMKYSYDADPGWREDRFERGECVNGPLSSLTPGEQEMLGPYGIKSILVIPVNLRGRFWGFVSYDDCHGERFFNGEEVDMLRSASLMMVSVIDRIDQVEIVREADGRTKLMLNATPFCCTLWDANFSCIDCNDEVLKLFGLKDKREYMDGFFAFSPEIQPDGQSSREKARVVIKKAFAEGRYVFDWMHQMPDGTPVPAEIILVSLKHGEKKVVAGYTRDLREYERLVKGEEEARELMNKSIAILENVDALISVTDLDYNLIYMNQNLANAFGLERSACIGKKCYKAMRNVDEPCSICRLPELLPDKDSLPTKFDEYLWDEVLGMWTESKASIIRWVDDSLVLFHSINDRSVKKAYEDELRKAMEASIAASASKTAFLANMSHEVRTPMNSIIGFAELALSSETADKTGNYLCKIIESAKWLLHIINDILDISKIESGKMELEKVPFDPFDIFMSCQSAVLPMANEKGLYLHVYAEPLSGKMLLGDPFRLYQALMNLLSNSVKFTDDGTIWLSSSVNKLEGSIAAIYFEVKDSGIGMTSEQIEKIFEPFVQADNSITRNYGGTGLGLTITTNIIEMMGGRLEAESSPGNGSKFSFELVFETVDAPARGKDSNDNNDNTMVEKPQFDGLVLLCEDNRMNQEVICEHLDRVGLKTMIAENGKAGVDMVKDRVNKGQKPFDLIFMDMQMPVMDGLEAAAKIAALGTKTPIVAMTANVMSNETESYKRSGMNDYVGKPFTTQELWRCLLKHLTPVGVSVVGNAAVAQENNELRQKLKVNFVRNNRIKYGEITGAISTGDIKLAHRLAHTLKTNAGLIGKTGLQKAAADIEAQLKDGKVPDAEHMKSLETELNLILEELTPLLDEPAEQTERKSLSAGQISDLLAKLETMLKSRNSDCLSMLDEVRSIPGGDDLARQIEKYNFKQAAETLSKMKKGSADLI